MLLSVAGVVTSASAEKVDLALVLAIDVSWSVSADEFRLQNRGYESAFRNPRLVKAIESLGDGIAVCLMHWSGPGYSDVVADWHIVRDVASADAFAKTIAASSRLDKPGANAGSTAVNDAIAHAVRVITTRGIDARRQTIDVSGDGSANDGRAPIRWRAAVAAFDITVNGLNEEPHLDAYYRDHVIAGPGAFVESITDYPDFATAILRKLLREIVKPVALEQDTDALRRTASAGPIAGLPDR